MKYPEKATSVHRFLRGIVPSLLCIAGLGLQAGAGAQEFPSKPIRLITSAGAGTVADLSVRYAAEKMHERLGWSLITDNRPGGDTLVSTQAVLLAPADGYSILNVYQTYTVLPYAKKDLPYDLLRDLTPLARVAEIPTMLAVTPGLPATNLTELVAYSKANPGKLTVGGINRGSGNHLSVELLKLVTGLNAEYIPYKTGGPLRGDLYDGRLSMAIQATGDIVDSLKTGKVRAIMQYGSPRNRQLPDVPTGVELTGDQSLKTVSWMGWMARAGTPKELTDRLERELITTYQSSAVQDQIRTFGFEPIAEGSANFRKHIEAELALWRRVVAEANLKLND